MRLSLKILLMALAGVLFWGVLKLADMAMNPQLPKESRHQVTFYRIKEIK